MFLTLLGVAPVTGAVVAEASPFFAEARLAAASAMARLFTTAASCVIGLGLGLGLGFVRVRVCDQGDGFVLSSSFALCRHNKSTTLSG